MNTTELTTELSYKLGLSKKVSRKVVSFLTKKIVEEVKKGREVKITGFGIFYGVNRKPRIGRNPQTGASVDIPGKKVPRFRAGKSFRVGVNPKQK